MTSFPKRGCCLKRCSTSELSSARQSSLNPIRYAKAKAYFCQTTLIKSPKSPRTNAKTHGSKNNQRLVTLSNSTSSDRTWSTASNTISDYTCLSMVCPLSECSCIDKPSPAFAQSLMKSLPKGTSRTSTCTWRTTQLIKTLLTSKLIKTLAIKGRLNRS